MATPPILSTTEPCDIEEEHFIYSADIDLDADTPDIPYFDDVTCFGGGYISPGIININLCGKQK